MLLTVLFFSVSTEYDDDAGLSVVLKSAKLDVQTLPKIRQLGPVIEVDKATC